MSDTEKSGELYKREDLVTRGVPVTAIPGLVLCEAPTFKDEMRKIVGATKPSYSHDEIFGRSVTLVEHIEVPRDIVFDYLANPYSLEEFTATLRSVEHMGGNNYRAVEFLAPNTHLYFKIEAFKDAGVVDTLCAMDQGLELWMRYHMRILDAMPTLQKAGTIVIWSNLYHPYYDTASEAPEYVAKPRARTDRKWVGEFWPHFYSAHMAETKNLKAILERRFRGT